MKVVKFSDFVAITPKGAGLKVTSFMDDYLFPTSGLRREERRSHRRGGEVAHVERGVALRRDRVLRRLGNHR